MPPALLPIARSILTTSRPMLSALLWQLPARYPASAESTPRNPPVWYQDLHSISLPGDQLQPSLPRTLTASLPAARVSHFPSCQLLQLCFPAAVVSDLPQH